MDKRNKKALAIITCILMFIQLLAVSGCGNTQNREQSPGKNQADKKIPSEVIKSLLPQSPGFRWVYNGFAEYGHTMALKSAIPHDSSIYYELEGNIHDPSGGEASGNFDLQVKYEITNMSLIMRQNSEKMMDNFLELELIRLPLQEGTQWIQEAKNKNGRNYQLICTINKIENLPEGKVYTITYQDKNSNFYEKRRIQEKWGVISFETVWESKEGPVTMGYYLYREASGSPEKITLNSFLPPLAKQLRYFGLAEYAYEGQLIKVSEDQETAVYQFNGTFQDGSTVPLW